MWDLHRKNRKEKEVMLNHWRYRRIGPRTVMVQFRAWVNIERLWNRVWPIHKILKLCLWSRIRNYRLIDTIKHLLYTWDLVYRSCCRRDVCWGTSCRQRCSRRNMGWYLISCYDWCFFASRSCISRIWRSRIFYLRQVCR